MLFCWIVSINKLISLWCLGAIILLMKTSPGGSALSTKHKDYKMPSKPSSCNKLYYDRSDKPTSSIISVGLDDTLLGDRKNKII